MRGQNGPKVRRSAASSAGISNVRPSVNAGGMHAEPTGPVISRRGLLIGAAAIAGIAAIGGGAAAVQSSQQAASSAPNVLSVPTGAVTSSESIEVVDDFASLMSLKGSYDLPYGTLVWANDDSYAACLLPTDNANPLTQVGLLSLGSGNVETVLSQATGASEGFQIFDARATSSGVVWVEQNILDGVWRIYSARLSGRAGSSSGASSSGTGSTASAAQTSSGISSPTLVEEGNVSDWDTPSITAAGGSLFWQMLPALNGPHASDPSTLRRASFGSSDAEDVLSSNGRMATPVYGAEDCVVATPRSPESRTNYQLTCVDADSGNVRDTLTLPSGMKPLEAGYGNTGFSFAFDAAYSFGDGIANLGTYTPMSNVANGNYSSASWLWFARSPVTSPAWCGRYFMVKTATAVSGIDFEAGKRFAFDVASGADSYGEFLASSGSRDTVVTYTNINSTPISGDATKTCRVRVWSPAS